MKFKPQHIELEVLQKEIVNQTLSRELNFTIDRAAIDEKNMIIPMSVSSDVPYMRYFGYETLSHKPGAIRLERFKNGAAFRDTHYGDQKGVVLEPFIDTATNKLRLNVQFSPNDERAITLYKDYKDRIRQNVSIRYIVHEMILEKSKDGIDYYIVTDWEPIHVSGEPDPADYTVGPGRSLGAYNTDELQELRTFKKNTTQKLTVEDFEKMLNEFEERSREEKNNEPVTLNFSEPDPDKIKSEIESKYPNIKINFTNKQSGAPKMKEDKNEGTELTAEQKALVDSKIAEGKKAEAERVAGMFVLAQNFKAQLPESIDVSKEIEAFVKDGSKSISDALNHFVSLKNDPQNIESMRSIGMTESQKKEFSYSKLLLSNDPQSAGKIDASMEIEACREAAKKIRVDGVGQKGFVMPHDVLTRKIDFSMNNERAALLTSSATAAGNLVGTEYRPQDFIELARNKMLAPKLGVRRLEGLTQNLSLPVQATAGTFSWGAEGTAESESNLTITTKSMSPKIGTSWTSYSRLLLAQSLPQIDSLVEDDLTTIAAIGEDYAVFNGTGANNQPTGIINTSNIGTVDGSSFNKAKAIEFQTDIEVANLSGASMYYVMNPVLAGTLRATEMVSGYPKYLIENGMMEGYPVAQSNQFPTAKMLFGDFSQCVVGNWGYELIPDPFSLSTSGKIRVTIFVYVDVLVRQLLAFSYAASIT